MNQTVTGPGEAISRDDSVIEEPDGKREEILDCPPARLPQLPRIQQDSLFPVPDTRPVLDISIQIVYYPFMIRSFRCRETEKIFRRQFSKKFPHVIQ